MKKVLVVMLVVLTAAGIKAQSGKVNLADIAPVLFNAVSTNNPLLIEPVMRDTEGDNHDMLLGQVASAYGVLLKQGVKFDIPTASETETVLFNEEGTENAILKYSAVYKGIPYVISARCTKVNGRWFITSNILPANQTVN